MPQEDDTYVVTRKCVPKVDMLSRRWSWAGQLQEARECWLTTVIMGDGVTGKVVRSSA